MNCFQNRYKFSDLTEFLVTKVCILPKAGRTYHFTSKLFQGSVVQRMASRFPRSGYVIEIYKEKCANKRHSNKRDLCLKFELFCSHTYVARLPLIACRQILQVYIFAIFKWHDLIKVSILRNIAKSVVV